ncbi:hypothetical protein [Nocardia lijiangensis]|nr:hypothetical protein [Nocardia lijiangensis]
MTENGRAALGSLRDADRFDLPTVRAETLGVGLDTVMFGPAEWL